MASLSRTAFSSMLWTSALLVLASLAGAESAPQTKEASPRGDVPASVTQVEVDWQATKNLVFIELPGDGAAPSEAQVRIAHRDEPLFFESVRFAPAAPQLGSAVPTRRAMQLMAYQPEERAWLLDALRGAKADDADAYRLEVLVDEQPLIDGALADVVRASDLLRQNTFMPLESTSRFADLRSALPTKHCVDDCYEENSRCEEDFCYWDYDEYMCYEGCEIELDECLVDADPVCTPPPPPTCTPGVVRTETDTVLTNSQYVGLDCLQSVFYPFDGTLHYRYYLTFQTTTTEIRRRADCTTYSVVTGVTYSNSYCYSNSYAPCGYAFIWPSCVF
ncbi:MAG: hypothetical protein AAGC60_25870 [Acidobacteriota bacterium]